MNISILSSSSSLSSTRRSLLSSSSRDLSSSSSLSTVAALLSSSSSSSLSDFIMGFSKTEVNLRRLLTTTSHQQNQAKLIHYVATLREQLEQLVAETTPEGLPRFSKAKVNDYSEMIESLATKLAAIPSSTQEPLEAVDKTLEGQISSKKDEENRAPSPQGLRRRLVSQTKVEDVTNEITDNDPLKRVKLDAAAQAHIEKHRKLQDDLTEEMVGLARQLKESSFMMNRSLQDTDKLLDSTEKAVEHSLASTGHANARAMEIYSQSSKTSCFTWLIMFAMTCIFMMVVFLIRVT